MKISKGDIDRIHKIINPLLGHTAWNVWLGIGTFITMEFGNQIITSHGFTRGEWHLWIYWSGWYLEKPGGVFIGCEDPRHIIKKEIAIMEGCSLNNVVFSKKVFETKFVFDHNIVLHTFPMNFIDPEKYWLLYTPDGKVLSIGPAPKWSFELSSKIRPEE